MVQGALERVTLDLLDQREVRGAVGELELEQRVGVTGGQGGGVAGQGEVEGCLAVAVQDGGNQALGAQAARGALAEVLAQFDVQLLSHGGAPRGYVWLDDERRHGAQGAQAPRFSAPRRSRRGLGPLPRRSDQVRLARTGPARPSRVRGAALPWARPCSALALHTLCSRAAAVGTYVLAGQSSELVT